MRYWGLFMVLIFVFTLTYTSGYSAFADDDFEKHNEHYELGNDKKESEDEFYEEIGEMMGWGTVITFGVAGLIFPMRRLTKRMTTTFPSVKQKYMSMTKFLGRYHILIGIVAIILSFCHGIIMYINEGELEVEGISGLGSVMLLIMASFIGVILFENKKVKSLRTTHTILIVFSMVIGLFHIFIS